MKFQLIRKFNLTRLLIAAATLRLDYLFQAARAKRQRVYPNTTESNFSWPQNARQARTSAGLDRNFLIVENLP